MAKRLGESNGVKKLFSESIAVLGNERAANKFVAFNTGPGLCVFCVGGRRNGIAQLAGRPNFVGFLIREAFLCYADLLRYSTKELIWITIADTSSGFDTIALYLWYCVCKEFIRDET